MRWTRLRWRMRGAWQWPTFALVTLAEAFVFNALPFSGRGPGGFVPAFLLAAALNLIVIAAIAPSFGWLLRRRRPDLPRQIARDYAGAALIGVLLVSLIIGGIVNHSAIARDDRDRSAAYASVQRYLHNQQPRLLENADLMDIARLEPGYYRACVPEGEDRAFCLFVDTEQSPPGLTRDRDRMPNAMSRLR